MLHIIVIKLFWPAWRPPPPVPVSQRHFGHPKNILTEIEKRFLVVFSGLIFGFLPFILFPQLYIEKKYFPQPKNYNKFFLFKVLLPNSTTEHIFKRLICVPK